MDTKQFFAQYIGEIIKPLVDNPGDVRTEVSQDDMGILVSILLHPNDMGHVIGKNGETIKALRHIARVIGAKNAARLSVKLVEPSGRNQ